MQKNIRRIAVIVTAAFVFTACASNSENIDSLNEETDTTTSKPTATTTTEVEEVEETETSVIVEGEETITTTTTTSSTTTTASSTTTTTQAPTTTTAPVVTTTAATTTAPKPQVTTTVTTTPTTTTTAPAPTVHEHDWKTVVVQSEPKWCQDIHLVWDSGFDIDLAWQFYPNLENPYETMCDYVKSTYGISAATGSATIKVEVWGTENWEVWECSVCHEQAQYKDKPTSINPLGTWQYVNGINPRNGEEFKALQVDDYYNFNTIWWDPYNIPQVTLDTLIWVDSQW